MLGTVLRLLRPSYALTALILFGGWQGYSFVKSLPERLPLLPGSSVQQETERQSDAADSAQVRQDETPPSRTVAAIQHIHPGLRILYWVVTYALICLASVPVIKWSLAHESNLVNGLLIVVYSGLGLLAAFVSVAFQVNWFTAIILILALVLSAVIIVKLAGELERMRVEDTLIS